MQVDLRKVTMTHLTSDDALALVSRAIKHVLYGPELFLVRFNTLTALRDARFRLLATMPRAVRDRHKDNS